MKPYYEHAGITIYHGDAFEVLPALADSEIDMMIADPPYGMNWQGHRRLKQAMFDVLEGDDGSVDYMYADCEEV